MCSKRKNNRRGQGVVEYILVTALVALATITMFRSFRSDISEAYKKAGEALIQGVEVNLSASTDGGGE